MIRLGVILLLLPAASRAVCVPPLQQLNPRDAEGVQGCEPPVHDGDDPWASWSPPDPYGYETFDSSKSGTLEYGYPSEESSAESATSESTSESSTEDDESSASRHSMPTSIGPGALTSSMEATSSQLAITNSLSRSADTGPSSISSMITATQTTRTTENSEGTSQAPSQMSSGTLSRSSSHSIRNSQPHVSGSHSGSPYLNSSLASSMTYISKSSTTSYPELTNVGSQTGDLPTESGCSSCNASNTAAGESPGTYSTNLGPSPSTSSTSLASTSSAFVPSNGTAPSVSNVGSSDVGQTTSYTSTVTATAFSVTTVRITTRKISSGSVIGPFTASTQRGPVSWSNGTNPSTSSVVASLSWTTGSSSTPGTPSPFLSNVSDASISPTPQETTLRSLSSSQLTPMESPIPSTHDRFSSLSTYSPGATSTRLAQFNISSMHTLPPIMSVNFTSLASATRTVLTPINSPGNWTTTHARSGEILFPLNTTITANGGATNSNATVTVNATTILRLSSTGFSSAPSTTLDMSYTNSSSSFTSPTKTPPAFSSVSPATSSMTVTNVSSFTIHSPAPSLSKSRNSSVSWNASSPGVSRSTVSVLWPPAPLTTTISGMSTVIQPNVTIFRFSSSRNASTEGSRVLNATASFTTTQKASHATTLLPLSTWSNVTRSIFGTGQTENSLSRSAWSLVVPTSPAANTPSVTGAATRVTRVSPASPGMTFKSTNSSNQGLPSWVTAPVPISTTLKFPNVSSALAWSIAPNSSQSLQISPTTAYSTSLVSIGAAAPTWTNSTYVNNPWASHHTSNSTSRSAPITSSSAFSGMNASAFTAWPTSSTPGPNSGTESQAMSTPCETVTVKPAATTTSESTCFESSTEVDNWGCSTICTTTTVDSGTWSHCRTIHFTPPWPSHLSSPFSYPQTRQDSTLSSSSTCNETLTWRQQGAVKTSSPTPTTLVTSTTSTSPRDSFNLLSVFPTTQHDTLESPWEGTGHRHKNDTEINNESVAGEILENQEWWKKWHHAGRRLMRDAFGLWQRQ